MFVEQKTVNGVAWLIIRRTPEWLKAHGYSARNPFKWSAIREDGLGEIIAKTKTELLKSMEIKSAVKKPLKNPRKRATKTKRKFSAAQLRAQKLFAKRAKAGSFRKRKAAKKNPVKRKVATKYAIRGQRSVKSGYMYYYLRGDQFVTEIRNADRFTKGRGEARMREVLGKLPHAIDAITLVKA